MREELERIAEEVKFEIPETISDNALRVKLMLYLNNLPEKDKDGLPEWVKLWFNSHSDKYTDYVSALAAEEGEAEEVDPIPPYEDVSEMIAEQAEYELPITEPEPTTEESSEIENEPGLGLVRPETVNIPPPATISRKVSKRIRQYKEGSLLAALVQTLNEEPPMTRKELYAFVLDRVGKSDDIKAKRSLTVYTTHAMNPKQARALGILCKKNAEKRIVVIEFPYDGRE